MQLGVFHETKREDKEAKKKLHTSEQEHEEDEDNEYEEEIMNIVNEGHEQGAIMEGEAACHEYFLNLEIKMLQML